MSSNNSSPSPKRGRSPSEQRQKPTKLFITNLDGESDVKEVEEQLRKLFQKYGDVQSVVVKKNRNSEYCFAFAEMKDHQSANDCVKNYDQSTLNGKQIKVEFQDDGKRRKDSNKGCYNCGKKGHFARECRAPRVEERGYGRRSRSRSHSSERQRRRKHKKRNRSHSSERNRSYSKERKRIWVIRQTEEIDQKTAIKRRRNINAVLLDVIRHIIWIQLSQFNHLQPFKIKRLSAHEHNPQKPIYFQQIFSFKQCCLIDSDENYESHRLIMFSSL